MKSGSRIKGRKISDEWDEMIVVRQVESDAYSVTVTNNVSCISHFDNLSFKIIIRNNCSVDTKSGSTVKTINVILVNDYLKQLYSKFLISYFFNEFLTWSNNIKTL